MKKTIAYLLAVTLLLYLPILFKPALFLERGNDLQEFFWPLFYYAKDSLFTFHELPLWNTMWLSGAPLVTDPQAPIFYIPNIIFLVLPLGLGFIVSAILHILLGGIGAYLCADKIFKFGRRASIAAGTLYILTPRLSGFIEAGHVGLIFATAWIPFVLFAAAKIAREVKVQWSILLAVSLAAIFYTHPTTFVFTAILSGFVFVGALPKLSLKSYKQALLYGFGAVLTFGLIAIAFLPQLSWIPETNRVMLAKDRQVWPQWSSFSEYLKAALNPLAFDLQAAETLDTERWIGLGISTVSLALFGFFKLLKKKKLLAFSLFILSGFIFILAANNVSQIADILLDANWYVYARVSTRMWFVIATLTTFLAAYRLSFIKSKRLFALVLLVLISELLWIDWSKITKRIDTSREIATQGVFNFLDSQEKPFRVFCTTRCFSQRDVAEHHLETVGGYATLHQKNYYEHAWQLTGVYWDYYTLAIPPIGAYKYGQLNPDYKALGDYNTKYIVSPYEITNDALSEVAHPDNFYIYENTYALSRVSFIDNEKTEPVPLNNISPNKLIVDTSKSENTTLLFSEVYSNGWEARADGEKVPIQETPSALRLIEISSETNNVELTYQPDSYRKGKLITLATLIYIGGYLTTQWKKKK